ncbi:ATP-binding protein [Streptomyces sp. T028]|uniref:ATP-binding protein n=1 Tax=Streptomyces sp. T028 TaxID=3394379 RepID=UPI003A896DE1
MTVPASRTGNLPEAFTTFVGRRHDIAEVRRLLGSARLLTLTGVGGVGKTRLALEVAAAARKAFPDGTWLVDLAPARDRSAVATAAATGVGIVDSGARPVLGMLAEHLAERRALIVLDNCEHLVDACAELVDTLLSACPGLRVLATSRQTLGIAGEHVFTVPPLKVPDDAVELLRDRACAVRPGFRVTDANWDTVTRLCADLDGLPLAIELAASRLRTLTVEQAVDRLEDRFALLTGGNRTPPAAHAARGGGLELRAVFAGRAAAVEPVVGLRRRLRSGRGRGRLRRRGHPRAGGAGPPRPAGRPVRRAAHRGRGPAPLPAAGDHPRVRP